MNPDMIDKTHAETVINRLSKIKFRDKKLEYEKPNFYAIKKVKILLNQSYVCWKLCITLIKITNV